jgi:hypothetical protein
MQTQLASGDEQTRLKPDLIFLWQSVRGYSKLAKLLPRGLKENLTRSRRQEMIFRLNGVPIEQGVLAQ